MCPRVMVLGSGGSVKRRYWRGVCCIGRENHVDSSGRLIRGELRVDRGLVVVSGPYHMCSGQPGKIRCRSVFNGGMQSVLGLRW